MSSTWKSRAFGIAFVAAMGLLANPVVGAAQSKSRG